MGCIFSRSKNEGCEEDNLVDNELQSPNKQNIAYKEPSPTRRSHKKRKRESSSVSSTKWIAIDIGGMYSSCSFFYNGESILLMDYGDRTRIESFAFIQENDSNKNKYGRDAFTLVVRLIILILTLTLLRTKL